MAHDRRARPSLAPEAGFCERHGLAQFNSWGFYECPLCEQERLEACVCGGTGRCLACMLLGGRHRLGSDGREFSATRCEPDCDTLCPRCCPDS
ncbi:MAG TPA: hypothetical protein VLE24_01695 [Methyloceanibacter sp.]|nr:hypothetical protein [Methyloceanibacter sp.]